MNLFVAIFILSFCIIACICHWAEHRYNVLNSPEYQEKIKFEMLSRFMRCLGKLSMADGTFSKEENFSLQIVLNKFYPSEKIKQHEMKQFFNSGKDSIQSFENLLDDLVKSIEKNNANVELRIAIIKTFCAQCLVDGSMHIAELKNLKYAASRLGKESQTTFNQYLSDYAQGKKKSRRQSQQQEYQYQQQSRNLSTPQPQDSLAEYYKILGIAPEADNAEVKKAYRKKAASFHPDKVQGAGLPEEFTTFAKEQFQKISHAYETICKARNMS